MKKFSLFITILAAVSMIACQKEQEKEIEPVNEPEKEVVLTTISATAGDVATKAYVDGLQVNWSAADVIAVANEDDVIVEFTLNGGENTPSATFSGDLSGKALGTYAVFPNTANAAVASNTATVDYKASWEYGKSEVPMYGVNDGAGSYTFNNIGGAIQISYTNVPASAAKFVLTETHIGASAKPITGTVTINSLDSTPTLDLTGLSGQTVSITGVTADGEGNAIFVIPVPAGEGYIFRFELQTSEGVTIPGTQKIASNQTINANRIKRFPAIAVPASAPDVKTLTFDFSTSAASGWSDSISEGDIIYTLSATDYTFTATASGSGISQKASYLMVYSYNSLGFPILSGYRLSKVMVHTSGSGSTAVQVGITSNTATHIYADDARAATTLDKQNADFSFDLTASYKDKRYYLYVTNNKNAQITSITLTYEESSRAFTPSALTSPSITCTAFTSSSLTFSWGAVANATGYKVSTDNGVSYGEGQLSTSFTWEGITPFTEKTIYVKAIGDGADYTDSSAGTQTGKTKLTVPTSITWTEGTKTLSWTDANSGAGTYNTVYKYVYTLDDGVTSSDATSSTSASLSITSTSDVKVKAICLTDASLSSDWTDATTCTISGGKTNKTLFHESFGNNSGSARAWDDSYSVKTGISAVYSGITEYTVSNAKQGKNTTGSTESGLNQSTSGTDAFIIIGPLAVSSAENMVLSYYWKAASIKGTFSTSLYYKTSAGGDFTEVSGTGEGATTFVERRYSLPVAAQVNTLYLKIVWNTSNTQAIIDEVNLQGDY